MQRLRPLLKTIVQIVSLQTPRDRLAFFCIVTIAVFYAPYHWLAHLSLWQALGIPAPSIGLTRSYWRILHGDFVGAWNFNRLIYLILALGIPLLLLDVRKLYKVRLANALAQPNNSINTSEAANHTKQ